MSLEIDTKQQYTNESENLSVSNYVNTKTRNVIFWEIV
jgi:hypothetical protein